MSIAFDTLAISRCLRNAGFTEEQADAVIAAVRAPDISQLATKLDLAELKTSLLLWTFGMILSSVVVNVGAIIGLAITLTRHG